MADVEVIELRYASPFALLRDLRAAGEANAVAQRSRAVVRDLAPMALAGLPERKGRVLAVLRVASMTGWAPGL